MATTIRTFVVAATSVLLAAGTGCDLLSDSPASVIQEIPKPDTVGREALPSPSDRAYYFLITEGNAEKAKDGPEPLLKELLENGLEVQEAWFPMTPTICMSALAVDALVVQLAKPDERILDCGYVSDPAPHIPNCGLSSARFKQYTFVR